LSQSHVLWQSSGYTYTFWVSGWTTFQLQKLNIEISESRNFRKIYLWVTHFFIRWYSLFSDMTRLCNTILNNLCMIFEEEEYILRHYYFFKSLYFKGKWRVELKLKNKQKLLLRNLCNIGKTSPNMMTLDIPLIFFNSKKLALYWKIKILQIKIFSLMSRKVLK